jgi:hypothetical protein
MALNYIINNPTSNPPLRPVWGLLGVGSAFRTDFPVSWLRIVGLADENRS